MKLSQVAVQLYTLRDFCKTPQDFLETLRKVRAIGYQAVQVSGVGPIPPADIASIAKTEGLVICATHENSQLILDDPNAVADRLKAMGVSETAYPYPGGIDFTSAESIASLCTKLAASGAVLAAHGIRLSYHNHAVEFLRAPSGRGTVMDHILSHTPSAFLSMELDTYWAAVGGVDPAGFCRRLPGRLPLLHLKDFKLTAEQKPLYCEIGSGNLDFPAIIAAAEASGCRWFIVEQDSCPGNPFDSIAQSYAYIRDNLVSD